MQSSWTSSSIARSFQETRFDEEASTSAAPVVLSGSRSGTRHPMCSEEDTASPADIIWDNTIRLHHILDGSRARGAPVL